MIRDELDVIDQKCPIPIIKISSVIKTLAVGQELLVKANDPVFKPDIEAWCRKTGNLLVEFSDVNTHFEAVIKKVIE